MPSCIVCLVVEPDQRDVCDYTASRLTSCAVANATPKKGCGKFDDNFPLRGSLSGNNALRGKRVGRRPWATMLRNHMTLHAAEGVS